MMINKPSLYYQKMNAICLTIIAAGVLTATLIYTRAMMIPLVIAIFFYTILVQVATLLHKKLSFPSWLAITVSVLFFALCFAGIIYFTVNSVGSFLKGAEMYRDNLLSSTADLVSKLGQHGIELDQTSILNYIRELPLLNWFQNFGKQLFSLLSNTTLIILFIIFLFIGEKKALPSPTPNVLLQQILTNISKYLSVKLITSLVTAGFVWLILLSFQVKLAFLFALFTFLLNFIPSIGSIIAVLLPTPVLFLQYGFDAQFWVIVGLMAAAQFIIGSLIEPKMMGEGMDLHPVVVIACLIFWGLVWGIPGAFLSVPITASLKIILSKIKYTRPLAELLAGRLPN